MKAPFLHTAFIALGSNLQDPIRQVKNALSAIEKHANIHLLKVSSFYITAPVGYKNQPNFINAVAEIHTDLTPIALLKTVLDIELAHGRERPFANAPRVLDCDILLYDDVILQDKELILPHPRMLERGFVMIPLNEIAPDLVISQQRVKDWLNADMYKDITKYIEKIPTPYEPH